MKNRESGSFERFRNIIVLQNNVGNYYCPTQEAISTEKAGADYIGVGAVFGTSTKKNARNMSIDRLKELQLFSYSGSALRYLLQRF